MSARYMQPLRILIQCMFAGFMIWLGLRFYYFIEMVSVVGEKSIGTRPAGIDGFLPISGFAGAVSWLRGSGINTVHPAAVIIFVTVVILSLLLRRSFCSWICPVATISEVSWKVGFRLFRRNWRLPGWLDVILRGVKYSLLLFFVYFIVIAMSSDALSGFLQSDYHMIADVRLMDFFLHMSPVALCVVLSLLVASVVLRNPLCRYLCPYGALLGLIAMLSPMRVTRSTERCVSCGVCSQICPTYIDVMHKSSVASPECISCWRCISHCRFNEALTMRAAKRFVVPGVVFAATVVLLFIGGTLIGKLSGHWHSSISLKEYVRLLGK
ncbi:MAG: 4Fe-4S binding protein [Desulfuromonadaceae bacterium]|nr:4Fe-4S binding protein [Desulfuromonadaceae bacterium]MDD2850027.1 4Fe-4S binding protein [Desulfuromonadaceae bacterium]MDD4129853.1 4Fe-4S binding protein [Desulfuromonadaceae bacterium]